MLHRVAHTHTHTHTTTWHNIPEDAILHSHCREKLRSYNKEVVWPTDLTFPGICITDYLRWATHTQYVSQKLSKTICLINSLWDSVNQSVWRNVYLAKFESMLKYGITFWDGVQKDYETLIQLQEKCVRVVKRVKNWVSCRNLFHELKILNCCFLTFYNKKWDLYNPVVWCSWL
jgi:hypothetical protein